MKFNKKNMLKTAMGYLLIVVFIQQLEAQEQATSFLKDYYAITAYGQYTRIKAGNVIKEDPKVNFDVLNSTVPEFGFHVNIYQTNHWNFKTGFVSQPQVFTSQHNFTRQQTGLSFDYSFIGEASCSPCSLLKLPLIAEYIVPINNRFKWLIASGFTFGYIRDFGNKEIHIINGASITILDDNKIKKRINTSADFSTGFYILFKHFMLQPELRYSKSFNTIKSGTFTTENYLTEPHSSKGSYKTSGDYWGFSLSIYIKKRGKNKPRKKKRKKKK